MRVFSATNFGEVQLCCPIPQETIASAKTFVDRIVYLDLCVGLLLESCFRQIRIVFKLTTLQRRYSILNNWNLSVRNCFALPTSLYRRSVVSTFPFPYEHSDSIKVCNGYLRGHGVRWIIRPAILTTTTTTTTTTKRLKL